MRDREKRSKREIERKRDRERDMKRNRERGISKCLKNSTTFGASFTVTHVSRMNKEASHEDLYCSKKAASSPDK